MIDWVCKYHESILCFIVALATLSASMLGGPIESVVFRFLAFVLVIVGFVVYAVVAREEGEE